MATNQEILRVLHEMLERLDRIEDRQTVLEQELRGLRVEVTGSP